MKLYFDCKNGVSGDMLYRGLVEILGEVSPDDRFVEIQLEKLQRSIRENKEKKEEESPGGEDHYHSRSYKEIQDILLSANLETETIKRVAEIFRYLSMAEGQVHKTPVGDVVFHEVGRDEALMNIVGFSAAIEALEADRLYCSVICDGTGTVECAHGTLEVPVPAVSALMDMSAYAFKTRKGAGEMVTPTGLAMLMGAKALYIFKKPSGKKVAQVEVKGTRDTGKGGMKIYAIVK